ncbi:hypothetical protein BD410DRAFT_785762 [Rickenella mellea]|uniref:Uncharacterized protein n=1 Tax=Rickenella mellea TaxID=50990 RepID=A0A4Y7QDR2_9AGAM|nr:hypothetical protein BD410DRAFT_785762 [Rickenella mellea]
MLLKYSTSDILNTDLVNPSSGKVLYSIVTITTLQRDTNDEITEISSRSTRITNAKGTAVAVIEWVGEEKRHTGAIKIMNADPVKVVDLFDGCETVKATTDYLYVPSRLDFVWIATKDSIHVVDSEYGDFKGKIHEHCIQVGDRLVRSRVPGIGCNYIEFEEQPEDVLVELLIDYILINIMRRTRFNLPKYDFCHSGKLDRSKEIIVDTLGAISATSSRLSVIGKRLRSTTL